MTITEQLKYELNRLSINIPSFEYELDMEPGTLKKDEWDQETIEHVYAELHACFDVRIDELEKD